MLVCEKCLNLLQKNTHGIASNGRAIMIGKLVGMWKESSFFGCRNMLIFVGGGLVNARSAVGYAINRLGFKTRLLLRTHLVITLRYVRWYT